MGIAPEARAGLNGALAARNFVEWRRLAREARPEGPGAELLRELPSLRGGREVLERIAGEVPQARPACERLARVLDLLDAHGAGDAVILDLGVLRDWPYYSGVVVEAYAPGVGAPIAVGGRYDELAARFGRTRPAVGFAITLDLLHQALIAADGAPAPPRAGVVLVGALDDDPGLAADLRAAGVPVVAVAGAGDDPEALAAADGWRWVARPSAEGYSVLDRATGETAAHARLQDAVATWT